MDLEISIGTDNSKEVLRAAEEAIERALEAVGMQAENYAKMKCHVDTGLLRNSITHALSGQAPATTEYKADKADKNGNIASGSYDGQAPIEPGTVFIGTNVEYAPYVEMGTRHSDPYPFLEPAITEHVDEYKRLVEEYLRKG